MIISWIPQQNRLTAFPIHWNAPKFSFVSSDAAQGVEWRGSEAILKKHYTLNLLDIFGIHYRREQKRECNRGDEINRTPNAGLIRAFRSFRLLPQPETNMEALFMRASWQSRLSVRRVIKAPYHTDAQDDFESGRRVSWIYSKSYWTIIAARICTEDLILIFSMVSQSTRYWHKMFAVKGWRRFSNLSVMLGDFGGFFAWHCAFIFIFLVSASFNQRLWRWFIPIEIHSWAGEGARENSDLIEHFCNRLVIILMTIWLISIKMSFIFIFVKEWISLMICSRTEERSVVWEW